MILVFTALDLMKLMLSLTSCFLNFFHVFGAFLVIFIFYHITDLYCFLFFACTFRCVKYDQFLISCGEGDILYTSLLIPTASYVIFDGVGQFLQGLPNTFFLNKHKHNKKVDINFDHQ